MRIGARNIRFKVDGESSKSHGLGCCAAAVVWRVLIRLMDFDRT